MDVVDRKCAEWERVMRERGHDPALSEGRLDFFAADFGGTHNGPLCKRCGWGCCWHCQQDPEKAIPLSCAK